jgi:hypothetical protein
MEVLMLPLERFLAFGKRGNCGAEENIETVLRVDLDEAKRYTTIIGFKVSAKIVHRVVVVAFVGTLAGVASLPLSDYSQSRQEVEIHGNQNVVCLAKNVSSGGCSAPILRDCEKVQWGESAEIWNCLNYSCAPPWRIAGRGG